MVTRATSCQFISSCCHWCFHFDTLGDQFGTLGASWGTILAPWDHPGGPWKQQDGHEVVRNKISIDFGIIFGLDCDSFLDT